MPTTAFSILTIETEMSDLAGLRAANELRWANAKLTRNVVATAMSLVAAKLRYLLVALKTSVPWWVVAAIHERECSQNWDNSLAQGDPWNRVSSHVPAGRGPFKSWEDAAVDALVNCAPYLARKEWGSIGFSLTNLEAYNGLGYAARGLPSPYLWAGTDQYQSGKYVADHVFSSSAIDTQPGCAALILAMAALDPSIVVGSSTMMTPAPAPTPAPSPISPAKSKPIGELIAAIFAAVFKRKP
jgi:lysozyme family protein